MQTHLTVSGFLNCGTQSLHFGRQISTSTHCTFACPAAPLPIQALSSHPRQAGAACHRQLGAVQAVEGALEGVVVEGVVVEGLEWEQQMA